MNTRLAVYGALVVLTAGVLCFLFFAPDRRQREMIVRGRLWGIEGETLPLFALQARDAVHGTNASAAKRPFPPWNEWPQRLRGHEILGDLKPVSTETIDGLIVTTFVKGEYIDCRWYYVVPAEPDSGEPWFRVIALSRAHCMYTTYPAGLEPVLEELRGRPLKPIQVIKRICSHRE